MKLNLKNQGLKFYFNLAVLGIGLLLSVLFFILDVVIVGANISFTDRSWLVFLFVASGCLVSALGLFFHLDFLSLPGSILIGCGLGTHLYQSTFPWADLGTAVPFFTNNMDRAREISVFYTIFLVLFALLLVFSIVFNFMEMKKKEVKE